MDFPWEIPYRLLPDLARPGASHDLEGTLPGGRLDIGHRTLGIDEGITYRLTLANTGGDVLLTGTASATTRTECARCLRELPLELQGEVEGYFILEPDELDRRLSDDEFTVVGADGIVDLAPSVCAALVYELPQAPLCREDCAGLCPTCGANLNEQQCACGDRPSSDSPFAALKQAFGD
ncbi:MAG: YceD family protein [Coriobacteriales bacterium]|jgi:uncharacterized protein|nr:YceD family protein [Coriobacteriales bacterium]